MHKLINPVSSFARNLDKITKEKYSYIDENWQSITKQKESDDMTARGKVLSNVRVGNGSHILGL